MIAIATHRMGAEADRIVGRLAQHGRPTVRLNTGDLEGEAAIRITAEGQTAHAHCDGRTVAAASITSAWLHQLPPLSPTRGAGDVNELAAESSRLRMWEAYFSFVPPERWLSPPTRLVTAGNKVLQLVAASRAGITVPETLVGNEHRGWQPRPPLLAKYLGDSAPLWAAGRSGHAAVTIAVDLDDIDDRSLRSAPAIFQSLVPSAEELRVVAVRTRSEPTARTFAASATKPEGIVDLRLSNDGLPDYRRAEVGPDVTERLTTMMDLMGVGFCSADFVVTPAGDHVFLDLNSTGAWWWIDDLHEGEVTEAISAALIALEDGTATGVMSGTR
ncbi:MAG TPA: hypothetical protein VEW93_01780 [Acidimicrobiales bacterium]|nr:hypothetical protein [Acidimicrobiales bacterium]